MKKSLSPRETWWWWRENQTRLTKWTLALLQGRRYRIQIVDHGVGSCNLTRKLIQANGQIQPEEAVAQQFRLTQGILAHEVGHALFTDAWPEQEKKISLLILVNILEDERIERAVTGLYPGIQTAIHKVGDHFLDAIWKKTFAGMDAFLQAYNLCLVWRWAHRHISEESMLNMLSVSIECRQFWSEIRPLVESAWEVGSTTEVIEIARQILKILGIPESRRSHHDPLPGMDTSENHIPRKRGKEKPLAKPDKVANASPGLGSEQVFLPGSGEIPGAATGGGRTRPAPYVELENKVLPLARVLSESLKRPLPDQRPLPHAYRGRYSVRQEIRTPETPHLAPQAVAPSADQLVLYILVDRSGSMVDCQKEVRSALMMIYLAATELQISTGIAYFGEDNEALTRSKNPVQEISSLRPTASEEVKAWIAGFKGQTAAEYLDWGLTHAEKALIQRPERKKVMLVIHDGEPIYENGNSSDWDLSFAHLRRLEPQGITPVGIYLGDYAQEEEKCRELFPRFVSSKPEELPVKLGNLLRSLY
ncbi:MAG: hypothetical protein JEZ06_21060 [Anaerolineaceae bacterium]|nr:hypothetical protein [Anaerolineaceae bacterium]